MADGTRAGRWASRMARGAPHLAILLALLGLMALAVARLPGPLVDRMIEGDFRANAEGWHERILQQLRAGARAFTTGALAEEDRAFLGAIAHASDFHRLSLLDADGRVFWSSREALVGALRAGPAGGVPARPTYALRAAPAAEVDDFGPQARAGGVQGLRQVASVLQPVTLDGRVVGAIEFFRDVTEARAAQGQRVRLALAGLAAFALLIFTLVSLVLLRASRAEVRAAQAREAAQALHHAEQARLAREVRLLGELNEWLQSCRSLPELFRMVGRFMEHVLPGASGSLYVYSNSRDVLEGAASWNGARHDDHIRPEDCWGLRRGRTYAFGGGEVDFPCAHVHFDDPRPYLCMPILAHGETVGLMTLTRKAATARDDFDASRRIAQTCAEQVSLAIANVRMRDELHHQAVRDPLTGLFNRRHMLDCLRRLIDHRHPGGVAVVSADVDHFKRFNDSHGHDAGDVVLRSVAEVLARHAGDEGVACRVGGEELVLLLPGLDAAAAADRAERLRLDVSTLAVRYGDKVLPRVTLSVGVAAHPAHGATPQEVIRAADEALYEAKGLGRNQVALAGGPRAPADPDPADPAFEAPLGCPAEPGRGGAPAPGIAPLRADAA